MDEPPISWIRQRETALGMARGLPEHRFVRWIAAHDSVEGDEIRDGQSRGELEQVSMDDRRRLRSTATDGLFPGSGHVRGGCVRDDRLHHSAIQ